MKNKYIITANKRIYNNEKSLTFIKVFLNKDHTWNVATNSALEFSNVRQASHYLKKHNITGIQLGSDGMARIEGPKGGMYSIFDGRLYK